MQSHTQHTISQITNIHLSGYKSITDVNVDFLPGMNIIIGLNGSGKTNFLSFLNDALQFRYAVSHTININASFFTRTGIPYKWIVAVNKEEKMKVVNKLFNPSDIIKIKESLYQEENLIYEDSSEAIVNGKVINISKAIDIFTKTHLKNSNYFIQSQLPANQILLARAGRIIAKPPFKIKHYDTEKAFTFIQSISGNFVKKLVDKRDQLITGPLKTFYQLLQEEISEELKQQLKQYSPIKDIRFNPDILIYRSNGELIMTNIILEFKVKDKWRKWSSLSDASKRLFQIISEVTYHPHEVFLIEEPELGLDFKQMKLLMEFLELHARSKQLILTTNNPFVLDVLKIDELKRIIVCKNKDNTTMLRRLSYTDQKTIQSHLAEAKEKLSDYWLNSEFY